MFRSIVVTIPLLFFGAQANCDYVLKKTYDASNFFDEFNFRDAAYYNSIDPAYNGDPTDGSVNYLNKSYAISSGLASTQNNQVYLGVDHTNIAKLRGKSQTIHARDSVRLESKSTFSSGLVIADIVHQPGNACGVWPSFWSYNFDEDPVGEIDLIEGINRPDSNIVSLHTCGTCSFSNIGGRDARPQCNNGGSASKQCEDGTNYDGCGNTMSTGSYGSAFNRLGGGVYATWLAPEALRLYWWPRDKIPSDITAGKPNPSSWGTPASQFISGSNCNVSRYFKKQTLIVNIDFCGDNIDQDTWDGECRAATGEKTCDAYVTKHPGAFAATYWLFNSIKLYQ